MKVIQVFGVGVIGLVSACGGSSSTGSLTPPLFVETQTDAYYEIGNGILADAQSTFDADGFSDPSALPTSGVAVYQGIAAASIVDPVTDDFVAVAGSAVYEASFDDSTVDGEISNLVDASGNQIGGELSVDAATINRDADLTLVYTIGGELTGELTNIDGTSVSVQADFDADFVGDSQEFLHGYYEGTVTNEFGEVYTLGGVTTAERQQ